MTTPVSWKGIVEQYAGRLNRDYEGKKDVVIYDYVDSHIDKFDKMYGKRLKAYRQIGYQICTNISGEKQEAGVKVTVVTWHPDSYKYGKSEVRMELLEQLRNTGFDIQLMDEGCECFAVLDQKIVWYGNMNFLSKEDMEDNLMRVVSGDIAAEIMEMTFGGEKELMDW